MVLCAEMAIGGLAGAALLLLAPASVFTAVVPWLVALGAVLLLARDRIRSWAERRALRRGRASSPWTWHLMVPVIGVYGGYFGAGAGVILLAAIAVRHVEPFAVSNAVKNLGIGAANGTAAIAYLARGQVDVRAAVLLGAGAFVGGWFGPAVVRWLPERPLRMAIGIAGLGLAVSLAV
ncbi:TSUP family transporter [Aeromicrobium sp. UC242_57]|uniref:TSUP family transporter n=1 Tax=Aeromicrobium sp. UC242_57 TaxID=3374624 RepID=UPI0037988D08